jgi:Ca2+-binding RTX toxin-like protein
MVKRKLRTQVAALLGAVLVISGATLARSAPAAAAETCHDYVTGTARTATYVGQDGFDGRGGAQDEVISTLGGSDTVSANPGVTRLTVCLGTGDDWFYSAQGQPPVPAPASSFSIQGGPGSDGIQGGGGNDYIVDESGADVIYGEGGNDTILGGDGDDDLYGGPGNDIVAAGPGDDYVFGDDGDDILIGSAGDVLDGGPGIDTCSAKAQVINCER